MDCTPHLSWFARRGSLLVLAAILVLATWLRLHDARESLWLDELHTAWCVEGDLSDVAPRAALGNQAPLYFAAQWFVVQLLGPSELSLRLLSLLCGIALPAALYVVVMRWSASAPAALLAAALAAVDPLAIFYAQEARPYAAVQLLALGHVYLFSRLVQQPTVALRGGWIATAALLFYLHYTAALVLVAEVACYLLLWAVQHPQLKHGVWAFLGDLLLVGLLCLPATNQLREIAARRENWAAFVHPQPLWSLLTLFPGGLAAPFILVELLLGLRSQRQAGCRVTLLPAAVVLSLLFMPLVVAWITTAAGTAHLFFPRYLIASSTAAYILAAMCVDLAPQRAGRWIVALGLVAAAIFTSGIIDQLRYDGRVHAQRKENWRGAIAHLNSALSQQRLPVLVRSGLIEADALRTSADENLRNYCLYPVTALYPLDAPVDDLIPLPTTAAGRLSPAARQAILARGGGWFLLRATARSVEAIERDLLASFPASRATVAERSSYGDLWMVRVAILP